MIISVKKKPENKFEFKKIASLLIDDLRSLYVHFSPNRKIRTFHDILVSRACLFANDKLLVYSKSQTSIDYKSINTLIGPTTQALNAHHLWSFLTGKYLTSILLIYRWNSKLFIFWTGFQPLQAIRSMHWLVFVQFLNNNNKTRICCWCFFHRIEPF